MKSKKFEVNIYHTSFCNYQIKAKTKEEAIIRARRLKINPNGIFNNLENWKEADTAEETLE